MKNDLEIKKGQIWQCKTDGEIFVVVDDQDTSYYKDYKVYSIYPDSHHGNGINHYTFDIFEHDRNVLLWSPV